MSTKLSMLWVDLTVAESESFVPDVIGDYFEVVMCPSPDLIGQAQARQSVDVICFDFDYPGRAGMSAVRRAKTLNPTVPMLMATVQHSEALAVWAFRTRLVDYLVKPISQDEVARAHSELTEKLSARNAQRHRDTGRIVAAMPVEAGAAVLADQRAFMPAIYYVSSHYAEKICSATVAAQCHMDEIRFGCEFKQAFGLSFRDYVVRFRLRAAYKLLRSPTASVTDVAIATGFNDVSYFSRTFKQYFGRCPSQLVELGDLLAEDSSPTNQLKIPRELIRES